MPARSFLALAFLFFVSGILGCPNKETVGTSAVTVLGAGVINNPANKSLRFDILKFGLEQFCFEMTRRGAPLKMSDNEPVLGRFFADSCQSQVIDNPNRKTFVVQYSGKGYGWTNLTGRIGFHSAGLVEYAPDFQLHEGAMYIYFRPSKVNATSFETKMVESALAGAGMAMTGVNPDELGQRIVQSQLQRGFTVIRYSEKGETDFGLGYIPKGQKPFKPFQILHSEKRTLSNDRTEVHSGQQDFVGGFEVTEKDQALYFTATLDGTQAADVFLVPKDIGDRMIEQYVTHPGAAALPSPPLLDEQMVMGQPWKRFVPLPVGLYYIVIDHTPSVGRTQPPPPQQGDRAAKVDYLVQLGDAP